MPTEPEVEVYWHRGRRLWSVRGAPRGRVVGHVPALALIGPQFLASEAARLRCQALGRREVHAFVRGAPFDGVRTPESVQVSYRVERPDFRRIDTGGIVTAARAAWFDEDGTCWIELL